MSSGLSVVIPTYRRPGKLRRCLEALDLQGMGPDELEVVVVEDGGEAPELADLRSRSFGGFAIIWLNQEHAGPATARNLGARTSTRQFIAFTDDDCMPRPDWARSILNGLSDGVEVIGGHTVNAVEANLYSCASQLLVSYITDYGINCGQPFFASNNLAISRRSFEAMGGFDEHFPLPGGEDRDLCERLVESGFILDFRPDAVVDHYHDLTLFQFWRQHFRYGRGAYQFHKARARRRSKFNLQPVAGAIPSLRLSFYRGLVSYAWGQRAEASGMGGTPKLLAAAALLGSQLPNALGYFREAVSGKRPPSNQ